jgi:anti-sigma factor RsiW
MTTHHLTEDELVLYYYGEPDARVEGTAAHLVECDGCRRSYTRLQRVMALVDSAPAPQLPDGFERTVWARLEPSLPPRRRWLSWFVRSPASLAWAAAIILLVAGAFFAGRMTQQPAAGNGAPIASAEAVREDVLLADVSEHLDRSQTMLVELLTADLGAEDIDLTAERERAGELVAANRLYRQTATASGDVAITQLLDELERLLVELAASPEHISTEDIGRLRQQVTAKDLLFKVRVVATGIRQRQKDQLRVRGMAGRT